jgi:hypothetical protein
LPPISWRGLTDIFQEVNSAAVILNLKNSLGFKYNQFHKKAYYFVLKYGLGYLYAAG